MTVPEMLQGNFFFFFFNFKSNFDKKKKKVAYFLIQILWLEFKPMKKVFFFFFWVKLQIILSKFGQNSIQSSKFWPFQFSPLSLVKV